MWVRSRRTVTMPKSGTSEEIKRELFQQETFFVTKLDQGERRPLTPPFFSEKAAIIWLL